MKKSLRIMFVSMLTALLLVVDSSMGYAQRNTSKQQSLVTNTMALKVANHILSDKRYTFNRSIFNEANNIRGLYESDRILSNIGQHLNYVDNFIVALLDYWGTGDAGYTALKSFYFTPQEYGIAKRIHDNRYKKQREEENKKQNAIIAEEQATYNKWMKEGVPDDVRSMQNYKPAVFDINALSVAEYIDELGFRESNINRHYDIIITDDGKMSIFPNDKMAESIQLKLKTASLYEFKNLKKKVYIPSKYDLRLEEKRKKAFSDKIVKIKWNKNYGKWELAKPDDFEKEIGTRNFYSINSDLPDVLNNLDELQSIKKKKHTISVTAYIDGVIRCCIDEKVIDFCNLKNRYEIKVIE